MIYSPSQTKAFLECPTKRMLSQEGWTSRVVGIRDWSAWIGQGVHAGLAALFDPRNVIPGKTFQQGSVKAGLDCFEEHHAHALKAGRIIPPTFYQGEAKSNIERCLEYARKNDLLPTGFEVERVEQSLGDYNCILDVVGTRNSKPTFIDWKVKNKCKPEYIDQELEKYRYDWKEARHYPWALSEVCGQRVQEYTVVMFILQPFKVVSRTYQVNWNVVEGWGNSSWSLWMDMENTAHMIQGQSNACMGGQWPCEYLDACWSYDLDRGKMRAGGLVQVQRLKSQTLADSQGTEQEGGVA